ncbi:MAG: carboxylesterase family protein [Archangium sp.]|nr:carboxylesterase family protein [Archangium sp.]
MLELIRQGKHQHVPFIIGTNADETSRMVPRVMTAMAFEEAVRFQYGTVAGNRALTTDATWTCPARTIARAVAANQSEPVFRYFFTWKPADPAGALVGATHGLDVPFVFRSFDALLAATGAPNGSGAVAWPVGGDAALELNNVVMAVPSVRAADCDFLDTLVP